VKDDLYIIYSDSDQHESIGQAYVINT